MGISNFDVYYSGFWSQGDGLSFIGTLSTFISFNLKSTPIVQFGCCLYSPSMKLNSKLVFPVPLSPTRMIL